MNQVSNESLVVPVLPATGLPSADARAPVPTVATSRMSRTMMYAVRSSMTRSRGRTTSANPAASRASSPVQGSRQSVRSSSTLPSRSRTRFTNAAGRFSP